VSFSLSPPVLLRPCMSTAALLMYGQRNGYRSLAFYEDMRRRRSIRFFSSDPIPEGVLENLIRTAGELLVSAE